MPDLTVHTMSGDKILRFEAPGLLSDLMASLPDAPLLDCGGKGICGKCAVFAKGNLSSLPDEKGKVLACRTFADGDAEVWLPSRQGLTQIETHTPERNYSLRPLNGEYATAVDIGTTTVVLRLLRLQDGAVLATVASENPQRMVAADVIGRIDAAIKGKLPLLAHLIRETTDRLENAALSKAGLERAQISFRAVTGNTSMLYLYTERNPEALSRAPFEADCLFGFSDGRDILPPCMGAFLGADLVCAVLSSGICAQDETALLMDIGTNGEIALWHEGRLTCCATAAGPAFEGGGIHHGVSSIRGAIDSAWIENGAIRFATIGGEKAAGICGSGLIDLVAALLELGIVDEMGGMEEDFALTDGVVLTRKDIRQVQLAKGAMAAGIQVLMKRQGIRYADIKKLYLAGGFGSHLNLESASKIGLLPGELKSKTSVIGNAALGGAEMLLLDREAMEKAGITARNAECVNLGGSMDFSDALMESMLFIQPYHSSFRT